MKEKTYPRLPDYVAFRRVNLRSMTTPQNFREFTEQQKTVACAEGYVLEIQLKDGSTIIKAPYEDPRPVTYCIYRSGMVGCSKELVGMPRDVPAERLWIQPVGGGIRYKLPSNLPSDEGRIYFYVPNNMRNMELVGDEYFDAAYNLIRGIDRNG